MGPGLTSRDCNERLCRPAQSVAARCFLLPRIYSAVPFAAMGRFSPSPADRAGTGEGGPVRGGGEGLSSYNEPGNWEW